MDKNKILQMFAALAAILVIVGKGDLEVSLRRQAADMGEKVIFFGAKTHLELPEIYASADLFAAPSVTAQDGDKEGFGLVIVEAMASGVPVVANNSGGITESIRDHVNGLLCEEKNVIQLADSINAVLNDESLSRKLVENGFKTAERYSFERVAHRYHCLLQKTRG